MFLFDIYTQIIIFMMDHILIILPASISLAFAHLAWETHKRDSYWAGVDAMVRRDGAAYGNADTTPNFLDN